MRMKDDCIFCKILKGDIPSFCIYENDDFKVILDRFPAAKGHVLILPKEHYQDLFELPEGISKQIYPLAQKIASAIKGALGADGINIVQNNGEAAGQSVFHFHMHIVPRYDGDKVILNKTSNGDTTIEALEEVAALIKKYL